MSNSKVKTGTFIFEGIDSCFPRLFCPTLDDLGFSYNETRECYEFDKTLLDDDGLADSMEKEFCSIFSCDEFSTIDSMGKTKKKKRGSKISANRSPKSTESLSAQLFKKAYECGNEKRARRNSISRNASLKASRKSAE
jgi:hypothetical protein